jgi:hypothetical protein
MGIYNNVRASNMMVLNYLPMPTLKYETIIGKDYLNVTTSWASNYDQPIKNKSFF